MGKGKTALKILERGCWPCAVADGFGDSVDPRSSLFIIGNGRVVSYEYDALPVLASQISCGRSEDEAEAEAACCGQMLY